MFRVLDELRETRDITFVIHGGAKGADKLADAWATARGIPVKEYKADWNNLELPDAIIRRNPVSGRRYDAKAGYRRNIKMAEEGKPDFVIAFPGGSGTDSMVRIARHKGIEVIEV